MEDEVELPDGSVTQYLRSSSPKSAATAVIAIKGNKVLLSREYSYPPDEVLYQFPGGAVNFGEKPEVAARRELIEETGYKTSSLKLLGWYYIDNRRTDAKMYVFVATDITPCKREGGDSEEFIESSWVPISSISGYIAKGKLPNFSALAAWALYEAKRDSLTTS